MSIAVSVNKSELVRQLAARDPNLSPADLAARTGVPLKNVKAALQKVRPDKPKSRA